MIVVQVSIVSSLIFKIANKNAPPDTIYYGKTGVSWALRFGGVCALVRLYSQRKETYADLHRLDRSGALSKGSPH